MPTYCDSDIIRGKCEGHLGKFDSCQDEAIYTMSLDGPDRETGESDFRGWFGYMHIESSQEVALGDPLDENTTVVRVPAGHYIVQVHNSGAVSVFVPEKRNEYETDERACVRLMDAEEAEYDKYNATYRIVRFYQRGNRKDQLATGLSLEEAQEWCADPEGSSTTATSPERVEHTARYGAWFEGYEQE